MDKWHTRQYLCHDLSGFDRSSPLHLVLNLITPELQIILHELSVVFGILITLVLLVILSELSVAFDILITLFLLADCCLWHFDHSRVPCNATCCLWH